MSGPRKAEAARWYQQARHDLDAARWTIQGGFSDTACFLAQQSGEKALKSVLYYRGARRAALLTHSIVEMVPEAAQAAEALAGMLPEARELDLHYIPSRYPNGLPSGYPHAFYDRATAERAVAAAERLLRAVTDCYRAAGESAILGEA